MTTLPSSPSLTRSDRGSYLRNDRAGLASSCRDLALPPINDNDPNGYYESLGLPPSATVNEIKAAYRRISRQCHPDGSSPDLDRFVFLQHVYETLIDPTTKWEYDHSEGMYLSHWEMDRLRAENPDLLDQLDKLDDDPDDEMLQMLEEIEESLRKCEDHYTFYGDVEYEDIAQEWIRCFLEAMWADRRRGQVRVGVREQEEGILLRKTPGLCVYFFSPKMKPSVFIAYWALNNL